MPPKVPFYWKEAFPEPYEGKEPTDRCPLGNSEKMIKNCKCEGCQTVGKLLPAQQNPLPKAEPQAEVKQRMLTPRQQIMAALALLTTIGGGTATLISNSRAKNPDQTPPAPVVSPNPTSLPQLSSKNNDPQIQRLIQELNKLEQSIRGAHDFYPLLNTRDNQVILFLAGPQGIIPPESEGGLEAYLKDHPELRKMDPRLSVQSIVVTDGTKKTDGQEVRFESCLKIQVGEKSYRIVYDPKLYSEIPLDRLVRGFKVFEEKNGILELMLEVEHNEHINPQNARLIGQIDGREINLPFHFDRGFGDGTTHVAEAVIPILMTRE